MHRETDFFQRRRACTAILRYYFGLIFLERAVYQTIEQAKRTSHVAVLCISPDAVGASRDGSVRTLWDGAFG